MATLQVSAQSGNLVTNAGFEDAGLAPWTWGKTETAQAIGKLDATEKHEGKQSFRISNTTSKAPHVYGALMQRIPVDGPGTYHVSLWCKGKNVADCWAGGGKDWAQRKPLPSGNFDWTHVTFNMKTGPDEKELELRVNADGVTDSLWIDDIEVTNATGAAAAKADAAPAAGLRPDGRIYPALADELGPVVRLRSPADAAFGADLRMGSGEDGLMLQIIVLDNTVSPAAAGEGMWQSDCVQIAIDVEPMTSKTGYSGTCFELGFGLLASGQIAHHAWYSGGGPFDFGNVVMQGHRTEAGYRLDLRIPWRSLGVKEAPDVIGFNMVVSDAANANRARRIVEWTPGISKFKGPDEYAHVVRIEKGRTSPVASLRLERRVFESEEKVAGRFVEYALADLPAQRLDLVINDATGRVLTLARLTDAAQQIELPVTRAGEIRTFDFKVPASVLAEGRGTITARLGERDAVASVDFERMDLQARIAAQLPALQERLSVMQKTIAASDKLAGDAYVRTGSLLAARYLNRVSTGGPGGNQTARWSCLQLDEVKLVLDWTDQRIAQLNAGAAAYTFTPPAFDRRMTLQNGTLTGTDAAGSPRPYYLAGYGHFAQVITDLPLFKQIGVSLIQQEIGPRSLLPDFKLDPVARADIVERLRLAADSGVRVDLLLSPHYFPQWAMEQNADLAVQNYGFVKYNIFHPKSREVIEAWLRQIVPLVKDEPGLFSLCLSNEPVYRATGRDAYTRPMWVEYLKNRHGSIEALNVLYETTYRRFEDVAVPDAAMPEGVPAQRAYFDWIIFNQQKHADWHGWMNGIVKQMSTDVPTYAKVMPRIFDRARIQDGTDPELLCEVTDLAGNDCWAFPTPGGEYDYNWKLEEAWYDLLHSFKGQPVINGENHLIVDGTSAVPVAPAQTQAVLWQGMLHHQVATTIWIWDEAAHPDLSGSIYFRPANAMSAARTMLDMNRLAPQIAAINADPASIAVLYSVPSIFWEADSGSRMVDVRAAINLIGQPATFISEKQLAEGKRSPANEKVRVIVIPHATHVRQATVDALEKFVNDGGVVVRIGKDCLAFDEYHRPRSLPPAAASWPQIEPGSPHSEIGAALRPILQQQGLVLTNLTASGRPANGIEYRVVKQGDSLLVPMINFLPTKQTVQLELPGKAVDLLSNEPVDLKAIELNVVQPRLLKITPGN